MLSDDEHAAVRAIADAWAAIVKVVGHGPTREHDLGELAAHIHVLQHAVMANSAARAHPGLYRRLGETLTDPAREHRALMRDLRDLEKRAKRHTKIVKKQIKEADRLIAQLRRAT